MQTCLNCGRVAQANAKVCPNCGAVLTGGVWPPPPEGSPPLPSPVRLKTGSVLGDALLGIGLNLIFFAICGTGIFAVPVWYFSERKVYPVYARWIGWSYVVALIALGGAFYTCMRLSPPYNH